MVYIRSPGKKRLLNIFYNSMLDKSTEKILESTKLII